MASALVSTTLANEGNPSEISSYSAEVTTLGFPKLAILANKNATPTAEIAGSSGPTGSTGNGPNGVGAGGGFANTGPTGGGGCLNPSCTSL